MSEKLQKAPADIAKCSSCGAAIFWAVTQNKKMMPLDVEGVTKAIAEIDEDGRIRCDVRTAFTPHFATCPNAAKHRKPRGGA